MSQYVLKGLVHPERAPLSVGPIKRQEIIHITTKKQLQIELNIVLNQITVWINSDEEWNLYDLRNIARNFVVTVCSVLSFIHGYYYEIEIIQILSKEKDIDLVFGIDTPCITNRAPVENLSKNFPSILEKTGGSEGIYYNRCFKDLNLALKDTEDTAFYCFRAIESLRNLCGEKFNLKKDSAQWDKIWAITGLDRECIKKINEHANESRHGDFKPADENDRIDFLTNTWNIIEKFIENIEK